MFEKCSICKLELDCEFYHDSMECYYSPITATCIVCRDLFELNTYGENKFCSEECKENFNNKYNYSLETKGEESRWFVIRKKPKYKEEIISCN